MQESLDFVLATLCRGKLLGPYQAQKPEDALAVAVSADAYELLLDLLHRRIHFEFVNTRVRPVASEGFPDCE